MAVYSSSLPSMHLTGDDLEELERAIKKDSTNTEFGITVSDGDFEYNIKNAGEFISDVDLPEKVTDYQITMRCEEGRVRINAKSSITSGKIRINGDTEWVKKKQRHIYQQFDRTKSWVRTHLLKAVWSIWIIAAFSLTVFTSATPEASGNVTILEAILGTILIALFFGFPIISEKLIELLYPYHMLKRDETVRYIPSIWMIGRIIIKVLMVLGAIGGIITILDNF